MEFQIAAVIILAAFYGCYFIKMFVQKKKGIQTDQMGKGKSGMVKIIELMLKSATITVLAVEIISIYSDISYAAEPIRYAGLIIAVLGDIIFVISVITMKDSWRAGVSETEETELVTGGIYQISRNPAFLGFDLVYMGILIMFLNVILLLASAFAIIMIHLQIVNVEEDFLIKAFGNEYMEYKGKVNRYLGRKSI